MKKLFLAVLITLTSLIGCKSSKPARTVSSEQPGISKTNNKMQGDIPFGACRIKGKVIESKKGTTEDKVIFVVEEIMGYGQSYTGEQLSNGDTLMFYMETVDLKTGDFFNADVMMPLESANKTKYPQVSVMKFI